MWLPSCKVSYLFLVYSILCTCMCIISKLLPYKPIVWLRMVAWHSCTGCGYLIRISTNWLKGHPRVCTAIRNFNVLPPCSRNSSTHKIFTSRLVPSSHKISSSYNRLVGCLVVFFFSLFFPLFGYFLIWQEKRRAWLMSSNAILM